VIPRERFSETPRLAAEAFSFSVTVQLAEETLILAELDITLHSSAITTLDA